MLNDIEFLHQPISKMRLLYYPLLYAPKNIPVCKTPCFYSSPIVQPLLYNCHVYNTPIIQHPSLKLPTYTTPFVQLSCLQHLICTTNKQEVYNYSTIHPFLYNSHINNNIFFNQQVYIPQVIDYPNMKPVLYNPILISWLEVTP